MEIAKVRKERGMTQDELARLTGISRVSISRYENGVNEPSMGNIRKISRVLKAPVDYLIGGDANEAPDHRADR